MRIKRLDARLLLLTIGGILGLLALGVSLYTKSGQGTQDFPTEPTLPSSQKLLSEAKSITDNSQKGFEHSSSDQISLEIKRLEQEVAKLLEAPAHESSSEASEAQEEELPTTTGTISGTVFDPEGNPAPNAKLRVIHPQAKRYRPWEPPLEYRKSILTADDEGRFEIVRPVSQKQLLNLFLTPIPEKGWSAPENPLVIEITPEEFLENIKLYYQFGSTLEVTVKNKEGQSLSNFRVHLVDRKTSDLILEGMTDSNGVARLFGNIESDKHYLSITPQKGYRGKSLNITDEEELTVVLKEDIPVTIKVKDRKSNEPIRIFRLELSYKKKRAQKKWYPEYGFRIPLIDRVDDPERREKFRSDSKNLYYKNTIEKDNGTLDIIGLRRGFYKISATELEWSSILEMNNGSLENEPITIDLREGITEFEFDPDTSMDPVEILIGANSSISGKVGGWDKKSRGPYSLSVSLLQINLEGINFPESEYIDSDEPYYEFTDVLPGEYILFATADGYVPQEEFGLEIPDLDTQITQNLTLQQAGEIRGRITDIEGNPASYLKVRLDEHEKLTYSIRGDVRLRGEFWEDNSKDGTYQLESAPPGKVTVSARIGSELHNAFEMEKEITVVAGEIHQLDFDFSKLIEVSGSVFFNGGAPFPKLPYISIVRPGWHLGNYQEIELHSEGIFKKHFEPGSFDIIAEGLNGSAVGFEVSEKPYFQNHDIHLKTTKIEINLIPENSQSPIPSDMSLRVAFVTPAARRYGYFLVETRGGYGSIDNVLVRDYRVLLDPRQKYMEPKEIRVDLSESSVVDIPIRLSGH